MSTDTGNLKPRTCSRGFTLVETMVAIAILAIALIGPFIAIRTSLNASYIARDQLIASSLAQEGMEYIRSIRDNNYLNGRTWMHLLSTYACYGASPSHYCTVDPTLGDIHTSGTAMEAYSQISNVPVLYLSSTGLYNQQSAGTVTRFKRTVQLRAVDAHEVQVTVTVQWITSGQTFTVVVTDSLQDWI